jgi:RimJ/RimL family protein N-acetyltransferase
MFAYRSLPIVTRYQNWEPQNLEEIHSFIQSQMNLEIDTPGSWFQVGIFLRESNLLIGDCGFHFPQGEDHQVEVGITLSPTYQGKGYATEAFRCMLETLFNSLGKHRVYASTDPDNIQSLKLQERVGMRKEAHFRQSLWFKGKWADDIIFALLDWEWRSRSRE